MDVGTIPAAGANPLATGPDGLRQLLYDKEASQAMKAREAGRQFEATLLRTFLNDALKPMFKGVLDEGGSANGIYRQHLVDAMANSIASGQSLGFSHLVQQQIHQPERAGGDQ